MILHVNCQLFDVNRFFTTTLVFFCLYNIVYLVIFGGKFEYIR